MKYHDDKNYMFCKVSGDIYYKDSCRFVKKTDSKPFRKIGRPLTGKTYLAIAPNGVEYEFKSMSEFSRQHPQLLLNGISLCIRGVQKTHKKWKFTTQEGVDTHDITRTNQE